VVGRRRILLRLMANVIRRPRVEVRIGAPIDALGLAGGVTDPPPDVVREIADSTMAELIELVAELRGEEPEHPTGVPRGEDPSPQP